jgi:hypothetical protein
MHARVRLLRVVVRQRAHQGESVGDLGGHLQLDALDAIGRPFTPKVVLPYTGGL